MTHISRYITKRKKRLQHQAQILKSSDRNQCFKMSKH